MKDTNLTNITALIQKADRDGIAALKALLAADEGGAEVAALRVEFEKAKAIADGIWAACNAILSDDDLELVAKAGTNWFNAIARATGNR